MQPQISPVAGLIFDGFALGLVVLLMMSKTIPREIGLPIFTMIVAAAARARGLEKSGNGGGGSPPALPPASDQKAPSGAVLGPMQRLALHAEHSSVLFWIACLAAPVAWLLKARLKMAHAAVLLVILAGLGFLASCSPNAIQLQTRVVDGVAQVANLGGLELEHAYELDGDVAMTAAVAALPANATKTAKGEAALAALQKVREKWMPVWAKWNAFADAETFYAAGLERGEGPSVRELERAYCTLLDDFVVPPEVKDKLKVPALGCAGDLNDGGAQ